MKGSANWKVLVFALAMAMVLVSCGGGGGSYDTLPINGIPGTGGSNSVTQLSPAVDTPPQENFVEMSLPTDSVSVRWVKNIYLTLPSIGSSSGVYQNKSVKAWADYIFNGVNSQRINAGLPALTRMNELDAVAQGHSKDMALRNFFSHTNPEGMHFLDRLQAVNSPTFNHLAENAAKGQETAAEVVSQWVASPGHRTNIMGANYGHAGIGVYMDPSDQKMPMHITMVFAEFNDDPLGYQDWILPGSPTR